MNISIAVNAATGRMGQAILNEMNQASEAKLAAAFCRSAHPLYKKTVRNIFSSSPIHYSNNLSLGLANANVMIDFSLPVVSLSLLSIAIETKTALLIGTTGFKNEQKQLILEASKKIPIMLEPNTSIGANMIMKLLAMASKSIGEKSDIEIIEYHHKHKKDAPSGTALKLSQIICDSTQGTPKERCIYDRTQHKKARSSNEIGISTIRAGDIVGKHQILFSLNKENIRIEHEALNRSCFAVGAIQAALWLSKQKKGLYTMQDFL
jgi:4-hydroxy-tetrahydrodipicolinate reductase